jgi:hypothetical protein
MVRVAVAGDVAEAEEIQEILRSAGIDAEITDAAVCVPSGEASRVPRDRNPFKPVQ